MFGAQEVLAVVLVLAVLAIIFVLPRALPGIMRTLGKSYGEGVKDSENKK